MTELSRDRLRSARGSLVINRAVTIIGALSLDGQICIEGLIDGEVRCTELTISERGEVEGLVVAEKVVVLGEFSGAIYARELILGAGCSVEGQIYHRKLVLEEGCYFEGKSRRHADPLKIAPEPLETEEDEATLASNPVPLAPGDALR
ncbi:MAG TPA: polymer-forming cytoskeletal protein [Hyphomicrobium sp.]|nr:polymer-forming cytoskeletal protein [Hyphomicrobium sp.]